MEDASAVLNLGLAVLRVVPAARAAADKHLAAVGVGARRAVRGEQSQRSVIISDDDLRVHPDAAVDDHHRRDVETVEAHDRLIDDRVKR